MLEPRTIHTVAHPFISCIYLKKDFGGRTEPEQDVLVIEATHGGSERARERLLMTLLADLDLIKDEAERKVGTFDRVDIRMH